jgi:hypothetical protein
MERLLFHARPYSIASVGETHHVVGNQRSELCDRRNVHHQSDIAPDPLPADIELDVKKQDERVPRAGTFEDVTLVATDHRRQGHLEIFLQEIGDCRYPAVEDDVAGLRQRLVFQVDDILQRKLPPQPPRAPVPGCWLPGRSAARVRRTRR